jgi:DNA-directed RNA polymerase subunit RPC12/RpoP
MRCQKKVEIQVAKFVEMKNGKPATEGVCPDCGTKVFRIGKG